MTQHRTIALIGTSITCKLIGWACLFFAGAAVLNTLDLAAQARKGEAA